MTTRIEDVEGIGPAYAEKLRAAGIRSDADLLEKAGSAKGRSDLSAQTGLSTTLLLKWVNHVDLMRISGVGPQFAELLEAAGVDTVKELAQRNSANLAITLSAVCKDRRLSGTVPSESQISGWIQQAKSLDAKVSH
jgi:predicted flap endonuclease-1-like 5' DNA nuclease